MKKIVTVFFVMVLLGTAVMQSCTEKDCPDDMVKCSDGQGNTFCAPKSVGC